jgi:hypothetical protein
LFDPLAGLWIVRKSCNGHELLDGRLIGYIGLINQSQ